MFEINSFADSFRFRPRVLIDVSKIDMSTSLLGFKMAAPIMVAPTGSLKLANHEGFCSHILFFNASSKALI